jgi:nucleoside-diphosphate-sugar epimerase
LSLPYFFRSKGTKFQIDVTDKEKLRKIITENKVVSIYHLAALLSVAAEKNPRLAEKVNIGGLQNVLDLIVEESKKGNPIKFFWPSSIAVYGEDLPSEDVSEDVVLRPITVYGKGKVKGEKSIIKFCEEHGIDARIIRFPGLNGPGKPGPGTTEYAIEMIQSAAKNQNYLVPLKEDTRLPMMDMRDAVKGIMDFMSAPKNKIEVGKAYNIAAFSFSPKELFETIKKFNPSFTVKYQPDELKQKIANSWPNTVDDSRARKHWKWEPNVSLKEMVRNIYNSEKMDV